MTNINFIEIIIIVCFILGIIGIVSGIYFYLNNKYKKNITELKDHIVSLQSQINTNPVKLSFSECNTIIDDVIDDIWKNKYFINYRLRDLTMIPSMDEEMQAFIKEVTSAIGNNTMNAILNYYTFDYVIKRITRKAQMLFIEYTNTYKPTTK